MLAPIHVENSGRVLGANGPICVHFTIRNCSHPLHRSRFGLIQEAQMNCSGVWRLRFMGLLLARSCRLGSSNEDWFSFWVNLTINDLKEKPGARLTRKIDSTLSCIGSYHPCHRALKQQANSSCYQKLIDIFIEVGLIAFVDRHLEERGSTCHNYRSLYSSMKSPSKHSI